jgi:hypothetical protein
MIAHAPVLWVCTLILFFSVPLVLVALHYRGKANVSAAKLQRADQDKGKLSEELAAERTAHAETTRRLQEERNRNAETEKKLNEVTLAFAAASARVAELDVVGREMLQELEGKAGAAAYFSVIVPFLEKELSYFMARAASLSAKQSAQEKRELASRILELLIAFFFPGKVRPAT